MIVDSNLNSSWENCDTNLALKDRKKTNKGKNKSNESNSQFHNTKTHCQCVYHVLRFSNNSS